MLDISSFDVSDSSTVIILTIKTSFLARTREATTNLVYRGKRVRSRRPLLRAFVLFVRLEPFIAPSLRVQKNSGKYEKRHVGTSSLLTFESEKSLIDDDVATSGAGTRVDVIAR